MSPTEWDCISWGVVLFQTCAEGFESVEFSVLINKVIAPLFADDVLVRKLTAIFRFDFPFFHFRICNESGEYFIRSKAIQGVFCVFEEFFVTHTKLCIFESKYYGVYYIIIINI